MWESSKLLMDASAAYQSVTGNPDLLREIGTPATPQPAKSRARYCGIPRIDVLEQLIEWEAPNVTGTEAELRAESAGLSVRQYQWERRYA